MIALSRKKPHPGERIRVMIVDDSVVIRQLVRHALEQDPGIEVVGSAPNGRLALNKIPLLNPDVITLDIEMPEMDGLAMLGALRPDYPDIRVVMFSTLTERGALATLEALSLGADDYVTKASNAGSLDVSLANLREQLLPKIHQFFNPKEAPPQTGPKLVAPRSASTATGRNSERGVSASQAREVVVIGISTGGPAALAEVLPRFPSDFDRPILIVQHMPPLFTRLLAQRLNQQTPLEVREAANGDPVLPGQIYIAPGDHHMRLVRTGRGIRVALDQGPPENSCRPAADVLFRSAWETYGGAVVAAVLTGMGQDGMRGAEQLRSAGAHVIVQDEATSVVWGMPGAVAGRGLADDIVPLNEIASCICRSVARKG